MIEVREMSKKEIVDMLKTVGYGHLACAKQNVPYIVPINYAYIEPYIYIYTTEGKKSDILKENPEVCLQIEDVRNNHDWRSVIINGRAAIVRVPSERKKALAAILDRNPTLTPAISVRWMDDWIKENVEVIYRIEPNVKTGRRTDFERSQFYPGAHKWRLANVL